MEGQRADVNRLKARAAGEALNVQFQGQKNKERQQLKDKELDIQLAKQQIGQNTVYGDLQRAKTQNRAKDIELQALKQTLASDEFSKPDEALMEEYKKHKIQKMRLEYMKQILKLKAENSVEQARPKAMESANKELRSNLPRLQKQNVELQLAKKARQAELSHAEDQHNQKIQL